MLKFCFWLYKKRWHTPWKFQLEIRSNKEVIAKKPLTNLYEINSIQNSWLVGKEFTLSLWFHCDTCNNQSSLILYPNTCMKIQGLWPLNYRVKNATFGDVLFLTAKLVYILFYSTQVRALIMTSAMFLDLLQFSILLLNFIYCFRVPDKAGNINFNQLYLHCFFTKSYVWPHVRIVSMRRF